jgi:hypothetical protein
LLRETVTLRFADLAVFDDGQRYPYDVVFLHLGGDHIVHRGGTDSVGGCREQPPDETKDDGRRGVHRASGGGASASFPIVEGGHEVVSPGLQKVLVEFREPFLE